jgi:hypothetical protein
MLFRGVHRSLSAATLAILLGQIGQVKADARSRQETIELWLSPIDDVTQSGFDIHELFDNPQSWPFAARHAQAISLPANYLLETPAERATKELAQIKTAGLRLNVFLGVLPVDKKVCGDGTEGLAWPGEAASYAARLKRLGADVASFTFDLPLSDGHFLRADQTRHPCNLSIAETAKRLGSAVRALRVFYPRADLIDAEVPTGMPLALWISSLTDWLDAFQRAAGEPFRALIMDAWWQFPWQGVVRQTVTLLHGRGMKAGIYIDESGGKTIPGTAWIEAAKRNDCALRATGTPLDVLVVANWSNPSVHNGPERDASSLTGLLDWVAEHGRCPQ